MVVIWVFSGKIIFWSHKLIFNFFWRVFSFLFFWIFQVFRPDFWSPHIFPGFGIKRWKFSDCLKIWKYFSWLCEKNGVFRESRPFPKWAPIRFFVRKKMFYRKKYFDFFLGFSLIFRSEFCNISIFSGFKSKDTKFQIFSSTGSIFFGRASQSVGQPVIDSGPAHLFVSYCTWRRGKMVSLKSTWTRKRKLNFKYYYYYSIAALLSKTDPHFSKIQSPQFRIIL